MLVAIPHTFNLKTHEPYIKKKKKWGRQTLRIIRKGNKMATAQWQMGEGPGQESSQQESAWLFLFSHLALQGVGIAAIWGSLREAKDGCCTSSDDGIALLPFSPSAWQLKGKVAAEGGRGQLLSQYRLKGKELGFFFPASVALQTGALAAVQRQWPYTFNNTPRNGLHGFKYLLALFFSYYPYH